MNTISRIILVGVVGVILVLGYGGMCSKKDSKSGSSGPLLPIWVQVSNPSVYDDSAFSIIADDNYLYIVGNDQTPGTADGGQWHIEKRDKATGALVAGFGNAGIVSFNISIYLENTLVITADANYLYIIGYDRSPGPIDGQWRIEKRDKATGALVAGFGSAGVVNSNPSPVSDGVWGIIADDNYIYLAGNDQSPGDRQWRIQKHDKTTGALDAGFGSAGVITSNPSAFGEHTYSITADANYLYIAGYDQSPGYPQWRIEKRDKTTGALVTGFGSAGVVNSNPSPPSSSGTVWYIIADDNYLYVAGVDMVPGNEQWRIEKRDKTTGTLVAGFGSAGIVNSNPSALGATAQSMTADDNYLYIAGYDQSPGYPQRRIEKRDKITGALVTGFAGTGVITSAPSAGNVYSIIVDANYIYIVGSDWDWGLGNYQWCIEKRNKTTGGQ